MHTLLAVVGVDAACVLFIFIQVLRAPEIKLERRLENAGEGKNQSRVHSSHWT